MRKNFRSGTAAALILVAGLVSARAESTWLRYDNSIGAAGNDAALQGQRFNLTTAVSTAVLKRVSYYYDTSTATSVLHVTAADHVTDLMTPLTVATNTNWRTVTLPDGGVQVPQEFFVIIELQTAGNPVSDNTAISNRFYFGDTMETMTAYHGCLLLRAEVSYGTNTLWADATDLGNAWKTAGDFGTFAIAQDPWIYHLQHGWAYCLGEDTSSIWFGTLDMGWMWSGDTVYPWMYRAADGTWVYYLLGSFGPRLFYNWNTGAWEAR